MTYDVNINVTVIKLHVGCVACMWGVAFMWSTCDTKKCGERVLNVAEQTNDCIKIFKFAKAGFSDNVLLEISRFFVIARFSDNVVPGNVVAEIPQFLFFATKGFSDNLAPKIFRF